MGRNFPYTKTLRDTVVFGTPRMSIKKQTPKLAAKGKRLRGTVTKKKLITGLSETTDSCCKNFAGKRN